MTTKFPGFLEEELLQNSFSLFKKALLLISFISIGVFTYAQRAQYRGHLDPRKDKLEYQGYTIRTIPVAGGALGYDITKGSKLIVHSKENPVYGTRLTQKEDVYKVAKWAIAQYAKTGRLPATVPPNAVKELHLSSAH